MLVQLNKAVLHLDVVDMLIVGPVEVVDVLVSVLGKVNLEPTVCSKCYFS